MKYRYATEKYDKENMARIVGKSLPISTKSSVEICRFIRNKPVGEAKEFLQSVIEKKRAVPFKRYNKELSHKRKIGPGRYPEKPSSEIIKLLDAVEANAQFKGMNTSSLHISHICAHAASRPWRYGRKRRRKGKRTHVEIVVKEMKEEGEGKKRKAEEKRLEPREIKDD